MTIAKKAASLLLALFLAAPAAAASFDPPPLAPPPGRVRILDYDNGSAAGLLFMEIDRALGERFPRQPAWQSFDKRSGASSASGTLGENPEHLARETAHGAYDLAITGDETFARHLESLGALRERIPLFESELILAGPRSGGEEPEGKSAPEALREIFSARKIFFTPMNDAWIAAQEARLWRDAGVPAPGANTGYVESGRVGLSLLFQAEDEGGYTLTTEDAFAQYLGATRAAAPLAKLAATGKSRVHFLCLIDHGGLQEERAQNAEAVAAWLRGEEAAALIGAFELGGLRPFQADQRLAP